MQTPCSPLPCLIPHSTLIRRAWAERRPRLILSLTVHLGEVSMLAERTGDLLLPLGPAEVTRGERVSAVADLINRRFGPETIRFGLNAPHHGFFERG